MSLPQEILVRMEGIEKVFPGVHALNQARFDLRAGEVHALMGENGAGKSTLMKVLTGIYQRDGGTVEVLGKPVNIQSTLEAQDLGISMIHQELNLMRDLSIAQNIFIGREPMRGFLIDQKKQNQMARELLTSLNINLDPETLVKNLSVAKQQMVEIAKALSYEKTRILIMDEPSAALTEAEIEDLFRFIRELRAKGVGIIYISHRMNELQVISDRITVMRDGQHIGTVNTKDTTLDDIISMMVGRVIYEEPKHHSNVKEGAPVVLEVKNLFSPQVINVSFSLRQGEILGIAGLMGAGRTELARLISGADKRISGDIFMHGKPVTINTPRDSVEAGIGYLSEDRKQYGLCLGLSVANNVALPTLERFCKGLIVDDEKIKQTSNEYKGRIDIRTPTVDTLAISLSGGNQQKVVISKWLVRDTEVLIFDEPTRGIDVGAKNEIYKLMNQLVKEGKSIIMISSELPELLRMSDRIAVMCEGMMTGILGIEEATQEKIIALQVEALNGEMAKQPVALALAALSTESVMSQLAELKEKGIPVIGFDSGVPNAPEGSIVATASTNNQNAAGLAAEEFLKLEGYADALKAATPEKPVVLAVLSQDATSESVTGRTTGFVNKMSELAAQYGTVAVRGHDLWATQVENPTIIIHVEIAATPEIGDVTNSANAILNLENLYSVFLSNEGAVNGFLAATNVGSDLADGGRYQDLIVAGFDAGLPQKNAVREGWFVGSVTQDPYMIGYLAVELAHKASKGEPVADVDTGAQWYTAENIDLPEIAILVYD